MISDLIECLVIQCRIAATTYQPTITSDIFYNHTNIYSNFVHTSTPIFLFRLYRELGQGVLQSMGYILQLIGQVHELVAYCLLLAAQRSNLF